MAERILVVDDEELIRQIIVSMLATADYYCRGARNGLEALALLESGEEFDLMLANLGMPGMDGISLLERTKDKYPDMPVVITSSQHDIRFALEVFRKGGHDFLLKPFEREQLLVIVRRALDSGRLRRESEEKTALSNLERSYDITLEALGDALDRIGVETEGHTRRVTALTIAVAKKMGLPKEKISIICRGAFLHAIGKLAIPDNILRKPGALTPAETAVMREHCLRGYKILTKIPFLAEAAEIVYSHHERYDGSGYPRGLKGDEIPLGARIFAVADTLDSITSDLPYRPARSLGAAKEEIQRWSGRQFDPKIVLIFLSLLDYLWKN